MLIVSIKRPKEKKRSFKKIAAVVILTLLVCATCATTVFAVSNIKKTAVFYDDKSVVVASFSSDPYVIVEKAGVTLGENDKLEQSDFEESSIDSVIVVDRAYNAIVKDGNKKPVTVKISGTVGEAVKAAGITLKGDDVVNYPLEKKLDKDTEIVIRRAFKVKVKADGETRVCLIAGGTAGDAVKKAGITLNDTDRLSPARNKELKENMTVKVTRVSYKTVEKKEAVNYKNETVKTSLLYAGQSVTVMEGQKGERTKYYKYKYVDGKLKEKKFESEKITKEPVNEVVFVGTRSVTKPAISSGIYVKESAVKSHLMISELEAPQIELDANGRPKHYKTLVVGEATAYSNDGTTAVGMPTLPGRIAVNPKQIPYGTKMYIVSSDGQYVYGYSQACDTGGFVNNGRTIADLYFNSESEAVRFGRRQIEIYILE